MNALFCWKESALFAVVKTRSYDSVKAISDVIETRFILVVFFVHIFLLFHLEELLKLYVNLFTDFA